MLSSVLIFLCGAAVAAVILLLAGVVKGISQRVRDRNAQHRARNTGISQVLHLVIQGAPTGIAVIDRAGDVVLSNPRIHRLGLVFERDLHRRGWEAAERTFQTEEDQYLQLTLPARRPGAADITVSCVISPLALDGKQYVVLYATDESELVRMEAARRDFVANVSHELKTPVGAMSLLVEALSEATDDPDAVQHFSDRLTKESKRLSVMISELISLSKLQGAESLPDLEPLDCGELVYSAVQRTKPLAEESGIHISVSVEDNLIVAGDRSLLITALTNLITNAINYSPEATPVAVSATRVDNATVALQVTDQGMGISLADQERIFERFYRVDKARSRSTGGTGLGLAIVKHVVANHGGDIKLWSRPGTGSTFTIQLPVAKESS